MADWGSLPPFSIDENSPLPKYSQLSERLAELITNGTLTAQTRLPSENELYDLLNVSRSTIRKALADLEDRSLVYRRQGQGSFVAAITPSQVSGAPNGSPQGVIPAQPHRQAKSSRGQLHAIPDNSGGIIGLLVPGMSNEIYPAIIRGVEEIAAEQGCTVFIGNTYSDRDRELLLMEQMIDLKVNGLIIEPTHARQDTPDTRNFQVLSKYPCPCVLIDNDIPGLNLSRVIIDDLAGGRLATEYLISHGHRRIAYLYKESVLAAADRYSGYLAALEAAGITPDPNLIIAYTEAQEGEYPGYTLTKKLIERPDRPSAIFYYNDDLAFGGIRAIRDSGLTIPNDISVIGSDNAQSAGSPEYQLCSIEHPKYFVGRWAADILFNQIQSGRNWIRRCITIHPELVVRTSVGKID